MKIDGGVYYHIHNKKRLDEMWSVGNRFVVDQKTYNTFFGYYSLRTISKNDTSIPQEEKIKEYAMLIRELVYEEVRLLYFPDLPSRKHCIWLCDKESLPLWMNTINGDKVVYKVKVSGNIHECYAGALEDNHINYKFLADCALKYWRGEIVGNPLEKEYLFEGEVEILEEVSV